MKKNAFVGTNSKNFIRPYAKYGYDLVSKIFLQSLVV